MQKIMFSDRYGLTQAVLEGRKTMTRRKIGNEAAITYIDEGYLHLVPLYAKYKVGEEVAVAQSYNDVYEELKRAHGSSSSITRDFFHKYIQGGRMPVSNKMFVKSDAKPHQIRITDINVERLQDISNDSALKEGVCERYSHKLDMNLYDFSNCKKPHHTPRHAFAELLDKVSGKGTWERNPWVFAYSFDKVK